MSQNLQQTGAQLKDPPLHKLAAPAESRRELRKRELRTRITESAMTLFAEQGFAETTIDDICAAADVARRTLYAYFPTKHDIIRSLCRSLVIDETINIIALAVEQHDDLESRLRYLFNSMDITMTSAEPLQKTLVQQLVSDQSQSNENNVLLIGDLKQAFSGLFDSASDIQGLAPGMSASLSAEILISVISALSVNWINDDNYPLNENLKQIEAYFIDSLPG